MVEVMGIEPMSQRVYHPAYSHSLIWILSTEQTKQRMYWDDRQDTEIITPIRQESTREELYDEMAFYAPISELSQAITLSSRRKVTTGSH